MDGRRGQCDSQGNRFGLGASVDCGGYSSSTICGGRGREGAPFANTGATDGDIYIEGVKEEGGKAIFSGRGGTGGNSMSGLFRGGAKTRPWSTPAAARDRVDLLDDSDLPSLDVTDRRGDSTADSGEGGCDRVWVWGRI